MAMNALARGAYWSLQLFGWNKYTQGDGLSADPTFLQRVTGTTPLEWDSVKDQVLAPFKTRDDGTLYLPWQWDAAQQALEKYRKLREAGEKGVEAKSANCETEKDQMREDEIRLDKNGRPDGQASNECSDGQPNGRPNGHPSSASAPAASSTGDNPGIDLVTRQTSGHIAAPTSDTPLPVSFKSTAPQDDETTSVPDNVLNASHPDVIEIRNMCRDECGKLPNVSDVVRLLKEFPADEIKDAFETYVGNLEPRETPMLEYTFFNKDSGGCATIIASRRKEKVDEAKREAEREAARQEKAKADADAVAESEAWKVAFTAALPTWTSREDYLQWKPAHPFPKILLGTLFETEANQKLNAKVREWEQQAAV
jgi:hypothetical protein